MFPDEEFPMETVAKFEDRMVDMFTQKESKKHLP